MLRTRPPRSTLERVRARLACIRHAASVDPEPGSNSPPKGRQSVIDAEASGLVRRVHCDSVESHPLRADRLRSLAAGAACDGHAPHWLLCCCWTSRIDPGPAGPYPQARTPVPAPSARSVFGTRRPGPRSHPLPRWLRPGRPLRQLVKVLPRAARQPRYGCCGTAASPAPSGRPFHFGGRSSPEPAKLTPPPASLSRLGFGGYCVLPFPQRGALEHRPRFPPGRRSVPHPAT